MSNMARYYDPDANPYGRIFPGVPLADIDQGTWDSLPAWLRDSVDASAMYRKTKPSGKPASESSESNTAEKKEG